MTQTVRLLYVATLLGTMALQLIFGKPLGALWQRDAQWPAGGLVTDLALGLGLALLTIAINRLLSQRFRWAWHTDAEFQAMLAPVQPRDVFSFALLSALAEECFFRGFLQPIFGLWLTALLFGLAHIPQRRSLWPWTAAATLFGVILGQLMALRGSLTAPIIAHFLINYINLHHILRPRTPEEA